MTRKQLSATLKYILETARERHCKSRRRGGGGKFREVKESKADAGSNGSWYSGAETGDTQAGE